MRRYLEVAANIAVLLTCTAVAYAFLGPKSGPETKRKELLRKGDALALPSAVPLARTDRTILLILRRDCRYCQDSLPFYARLLDRVRTTSTNRPTLLQLIVLSTDPTTEMQAFLTQQTLAPYATIQLTAPLSMTRKIPGTPSLIIVNQDGIVQNAWFGKLGADAEKRVEHLLFDLGG